MFLDLFDTAEHHRKLTIWKLVKTYNSAEIALFYLMIMGFRPTLTQRKSDPTYY